MLYIIQLSLFFEHFFFIFGCAEESCTSPQFFFFRTSPPLASVNGESPWCYRLVFAECPSSLLCLCQVEAAAVRGRRASNAIGRRRGGVGYTTHDTSRIGRSGHDGVKVGGVVEMM